MIFFISGKNFSIRVENETIFCNIVIWYPFYSNFATFTDFEEKSKSFPKKTSLFFKKTQISYPIEK